MIEYWDLYDENRCKLNKVVKREDTLSDDEYHMVVNAWIKNSKGEFLITQRVASKAHPLMWECTGGSALFGEESITSAIREIKEELGIDVTNAHHELVGSTKRYYVGCPDILDVWIFYYDVDINDVKIQKSEVNNAMWIDKEELFKLYNGGKFEANAYFMEVNNDYKRCKY